VQASWTNAMTPPTPGRWVKEKAPPRPGAAAVSFSEIYNPKPCGQRFQKTTTAANMRISVTARRPPWCKRTAWLQLADKDG
jgi:hypothetical protein